MTVLDQSGNLHSLGHSIAKICEAPKHEAMQINAQSWIDQAVPSLSQYKTNQQMAGGEPTRLMSMLWLLLLCEACGYDTANANTQIMLDPNRLVQVED